MEKVIFDCDNTMGLRTKEVDDGLTYYYLLGRPDIDVLGITTTFGNGTIDQVYGQTQKMVVDSGWEDLPVKRGAGKRGEGPTEAAHYLAEMAVAHSGELTVLATGPLGNLRGAAELDPEFYSNLKGIACMGGYLRPIKMGRRDVKELNLSADPEASYQVLNAPCPVTLMNAQICLQAPFTWKNYGKLKFWSRRTRRSVREWLILHAIFCGTGHFYLWDMLPAISISYPELFHNHLVSIQSSVEDLENGTLLPAETDDIKGLNMPVLINDLDQFMEILFTAWQKVAV